MDLIDIILAKKMATSDPCISISNIVQTETSTESEGRNTLTVTLTNGATSKFYTYNGSQGESGVYIGESQPIDKDIKVWINPNGDADSIPIATTTSIGGIKVGNGLAIDKDGVLSLSLSSANGVSF